VTDGKEGLFVSIDKEFEQIEALAETYPDGETARRAQPNDLFGSCGDYWGTASPTFMENWPSDLRDISIPSYDRELSRDEALVLGASIWDWGECFDVSHLSDERVNELRASLIQWLDSKVKLMPNGAFVRLGSRSPKDGLYWGQKPTDDTEGRVRTGEEAFWRMTAASERIADDLRLQLGKGYAPHIFVRQWIDMPEWCEFRCFQQNGRLIGISQYYNRGVYQEVCEDAAGMKWAIEQFHQLVFKPITQDNPTLKNVVFDIFVKPLIQVSIDGSGKPIPGTGSRRYEVKLLEINPFFNLTDPCLFDWNAPSDFRGQLRYRTELGPRATSTKEV
jgi:hypothetical protein